jgi:ATP-binding cassette subfamily F protein uup
MPADALQRKSDGPAASRRPAKLSFKETRELEALPGQLEALELEQKSLTEKLADPALYQDRTVDVRALNARHDQIESELTRLLARWEELEAKTGR